MGDFGSYEILQRAVDTIKNDALPYADPTDIFNFGENSNIIRSMKYPNGQIYGYTASGTGTTEIVPSVSTTSMTTSTNTALSVTEDGQAFEGLAEIPVRGYFGHSVLGSLSILNDINAIANSIGINANAIEDGHDPLWLDKLAEQNPDLYTFLNSSTIDYINGVPMIHDVVDGISYINEDGVSLAIELMLAQGVQKDRQDPAIPNCIAIPYSSASAYTYTNHGYDANDDLVITDFTTNANVKYISYKTANGDASTLAISTTNFTGQTFEYDYTRWGVTNHSTQTFNPASYVFNGKRVYYEALPYCSAKWGTGVNEITNNAPLGTYAFNDSNDQALMSWLACYGMQSYPNEYGAKPSANTVDITGYKGLTAKQKIERLGHDYPQWVANKRTTRALDQHGNVSSKDWLPVQLPFRFNNNDVNDGYNTDGTQTADGSYPSTEVKSLALALPVLNGVNALVPVLKTPNVYIETTPDNPVIKIPFDFTPTITTGALIGHGAVDVDDIPTDGAHVYLPTRDKVNELMHFLWAGPFTPESLRKIFQNPIEAIVGLQQIYFTPRVDGQDEIILGNVHTEVDDVDYTTKRFYRVDCGYVSLYEYYGNVFDYRTEISIYLPFIGIVPLDVDKVMRCSKIRVVYDLDILTGAGNAKILATRDGNEILLYTYGCQTASEYPISGSNHSGIFNTVLSLGAMAIGVAVTGGAGAGAGGMITGAGVNSVINRLGNSMAGMKSHIQQSGGFMGNGGLIHKTPYLIIDRPIPNMPVDYQIYQGFPYYKSTTLGNCQGFTQCSDVHIDIDGMTNVEKEMIMNDLKKGVII